MHPYGLTDYISLPLPRDVNLRGDLCCFPASHMYFCANQFPRYFSLTLTSPNHSRQYALPSLYRFESFGFYVYKCIRVRPISPDTHRFGEDIFCPASLNLIWYSMCSILLIQRMHNLSIEIRVCVFHSL